MNILDTIVLRKIEEVDYLRKTISLSQLQQTSNYNRKCHTLSDRLLDKSNLGIIAEYKRKSPSKGLINKHGHTPANIAKAYADAGAVAISTLTDTEFFGAKDTDIQNVRSSIDIPLLRKDFMIDPYQIHQAKAMGADVILLIGAIINKDKAIEMTEVSHSLGLQVLYEVHNISELENIPITVDIIGINNRDLKEFKVDYNHSIKIKNELDTNKPLISESGLSDPKIVHMLQAEGFNGFLIGEAFMKTEAPGESCKSFVDMATNNKTMDS